MSKGEKNGYLCENPTCGHLLVTIDLDDGTTPMFKRCPKCASRAVSQWYRIDQTLPVEGYWFKPKSLKGYSPSMRDHIQMGGLDYREAS